MMRLPLAIRLRFAASFVGLSLFAFFFIIYHLDLHLYEILGAAMTDGRQRIEPFGDFGSVLQAAICWHNGINVYQPTACMGGGMYNYSPLLLRVGYLPIKMRQIMFYGFSLDLLFICSLACLPPPGSAPEILVRVAAIVSPAVVFATEQGNFDVVIFLLIVLGSMLLLRGNRMSATGYAVFTAAALIKFYPAILMALTLREKFRRLILIAAASMLCLTSFIWYFHRELHEALEIIPWGLPFGNTFGASNLPFGLALLKSSPRMTINLDLAEYHIAIASPLTSFMFGFGTKLLSGLVILGAFMRAPRYQVILDGIGAEQKVFLLSGILIISGCFFTAQNLAYREIFLILALPGLWAMAARSNGFMRFKLLWLNAAVVVVLWEEISSLAIKRITAQLGNVALVNFVEISYWLLKEVLWWWIIFQFTAILAAFARTELTRLVESHQQKAATA
jgi:hypothetical protein